MTYKDRLREIIQDPSASWWLRDAAAALDARDPIDALGDSQVLSELMALRAEEVFPSLRHAREAFGAI